jgi:ribulose-5-phosphate 4-epimerase/fuculose-1-phosphate aldolase
MIDEGYIKYHCQLLPAPPPDEKLIHRLNYWRNLLYDLGLIGQYPNGIGYGNVSQREANPKQFLVSGTKTGAIPRLNPEHYTRVIDYDTSENRVTCEGLIQASSESLTHGAIYDSNMDVKAVFHIHHLQLWRALLHKVPTTREKIAYGTPEMAQELISIARENAKYDRQIVAMSGHEEGLIAFATTLDGAGNLLLEYYRKLISSD